MSYRLPETEEHTTLILGKNSVKEFLNYGEISSESGFVFTPFDTENTKRLFITPNEILYGDKGFRGDLFLDKTQLKNTSELPKNDENKTTYENHFHKMHNLLQKEVLQKVILSRTLTISDFPKEEHAYLYYNLAEAYPTAMVYWVHLPHLGIEWIGATPELLVKQKEGNLHTLALAGTKMPTEHWTAKEKEEQQIVADYIASQLAEFHPSVSDTKTLDTGAVQHLATHFCIPNSCSQLFPIVKKLHPTPAICGLPKAKAFEQIQNIETHSRNYYCGVLGAININENTALYVNLRCMQLSENAVQLYVGGGLTKDSILEKEWQETERKADTLRKFIK